MTETTRIPGFAILGTSIGFCFRHILTILFCTVPLTTLGAVLAFAVIEMADSYISRSRDNEYLGFFVFAGMWSLFLVVAAVVGGIVAQISATQTTGFLNRVAAVYVHLLGRFLPLIGIGIVLGICLALPFLGSFLIVLAGGAFVTVLLVLLCIILGITGVLAVLGPGLHVCMVEKQGVRAALRRSRYLSRGQRWRAIWPLAVVIIGGFMILPGIASFLLGTAPMVVGLPRAVSNIILAVGSVGVFYFLVVLVAAFLALYTEHLIILREGMSAENVADVFD